MGKNRSDVGTNTAQFAFSQKLKTPPTTRAATEADKSADAVTRPSGRLRSTNPSAYGKGRLPAISITPHAAMEYCR